jgi:hypothetical protein
MGERRQGTRKKSFLRGCVYFNKRRSAVDCLIRDLSEGGARVIFSDAVSVPDIVELYIPQKEQTVRAHVEWRHGDELGLSFPEAALAAGPMAEVGDLAQRVTRLESEIAALRRLLKQMRSELPGGNDLDAA